ncbi:LppU/SCO3897 family protein [Kitasatospora kazusensis]|uniref:LppU/SCO3897 family protein n=1 Tax=Kitasatospora kazusensis TaxID=407974 RepID=UPI0031D194D1
MAFRSVQTGECVSNYLTGMGSLWSSDVPVVVDCRGGSAYYRVTAATTTQASCPTQYGQTSLGHTNGDHTTTVLCLARQFQVNQCFPANTPDYQKYDGFLEVVTNCKPAQFPPGSNVIMQITAVIPAGNKCPPLPGWHTTSWAVLDKTTQICVAAVWAVKG